MSALKPLLKIVSGGQSGVDRGALDAALEAGFPCGGWCPRGRMAEDGPIDVRYPLAELEGGYSERTRRNVQDSDATVIVYYGQLEGGTANTLDFCVEDAKPHCLIDALEVDSGRAGQLIWEFVLANSVAVLNVAGPRASKQAGARRYVKRAVSEALRLGGSRP